MENPASIVDIATKTAKECLQHLHVPYHAKCHCKPSSTKDCWNNHLIAGLPKKKTEKEKKTVLSRGKLKCRNSAGLVLQVKPSKIR